MDYTGLSIIDIVGGSQTTISLIHMAGVGEETGQLPEMMARVADSLDFEVDSTLGRLTTLLEPIIIIVMGLIVGFIVLAVLLPIFQINASIGR